MSSLKRAFLYVLRKKRQTFLLLSLITIVLSTLLLCCTFYVSANNSIEEIKATIGGSITISADKISADLAEDIFRIKHVTRYNARDSEMGRFYGADGTVFETITEGASGNAEGYSNCGRIRSNTTSELDSYFAEEGFTIFEGRHIVSGDENVILIHQEFAEKNNLSVGDTIEIEGAVGNTARVQVKIIGTYKNKDEQAGIVLEHQLYKNMVFIDTLTYCMVYRGENTGSSSTLDLTIDDPTAIDEIIASIHEVAGGESADWIIQGDDSLYQQASAPIKSNQGLIMSGTIIIVIMAFATITLLLLMSVRGRMRETGIYLSMGLSKPVIVRQYIIEAMLLFFAAIPISCIIWASAIGAMSAGLNMDSSAIIRPSTILIMLSVASALIITAIFISVLIASIPMYRLHPRNLLLFME